MGVSGTRETVEAYQRAIGDVSELVGSRARVLILKKLAEEGSAHRDELREAVPKTRTTVTRNLDRLEELGWVSHSGAEYSVNACGRLVLEELDTLVERTVLANRLQKALKWLPEGALELDLRRFETASVLVPEPGNPYSMINRQVQLLREADRCVGVLRVTGLHAAEAGYDLIFENDGVAILVVSPSVAETFTKDSEFVPLIEEMLASDRFDVYVYEDEIPYSLVLLDDVVHLTIDDDGEPRALIESTEPDLVDWTMETFESYRKSAEPIQRYSS